MYEHAVAYYDDEQRFLAVVTDYVALGLEAGERVIVAIRGSLLPALERKLHSRLDVAAARDSGQLVLLDAAKTLALFMVDGTPDPELFRIHVADHVVGEGGAGTLVRAFGEMVAVLWEEGNVAGAIQLEGLWNTLLEQEPFGLMCAYPASALVGSSLLDIRSVCRLHSSVLPPASYAADAVAAASTDDRPDVRTAVFLPIAEAVGATRRFVTQVLRSWDLSLLQWEAVLVASELANNAVRHGASPFRVLVSRAGRGVRIGIQDLAPGEPLLRSARQDAIDGRGMTIVAALSVRWGCEPLTGGKFTWAELDGSSV